MGSSFLSEVETETVQTIIKMISSFCFGRNIKQIHWMPCEQCKQRGQTDALIRTELATETKIQAKLKLQTKPNTNKACSHVHHMLTVWQLKP